MAEWTLEPERANVHGSFSRDLPPILTIDSGDTVTYRTLDAAWNLEAPPLGDPRPRPVKLGPRDPTRDGGHCLVGPIAIRGAEPGMTLEACIEDVRVGDYGFTISGGWPHPVLEHLGIADGKEAFHLWSFDADRTVGRNQFGHEVSLRPFMGVMGMPPADPGCHDTAPPRPTGGNLDCKELVAGTRLFLPVAVRGGLFSVGDGHAAQGDGEVCVTAIECPMQRVRLRFVLHEDMPLTMPRARTADSWITFGLDADLNLASLQAVEGMVDLIRELHGLDRRDALALASLAADLRITQIVNGVQGVHAVLRDGAIRLGSGD